MVDKIQDNDEYEFVDYDTISTDPMGQDDEVVERTTRVRSAGGGHVIRNAIIAIVLILLALVVYRFISSFTKKTTSSDASIPTITTPTDQSSTSTTNTATTNAIPADTSAPIAALPTGDMQTQQPQSPESTPVQTTTSSSTTTTPTTVTVSTPSPDVSQLDQKISAIDINQQGMRADINTLNNQLSGISSNISNLNVKIENLAQTINTLSATIEKQVSQITALSVVKKAPKVRKVVRRVIVPRRVYYIQAVIPGRAWLIASNGSTLTVREGTNIPGYGVVKLIDPNQGRVLTSSGQVIRFSQQDS
ncbi:protein IcmG (DotF) [Legionella busanensis]|uniref:Protein IcmG (DotF) n=1 Tax=Legionella busanensis TaxID=190655 RepID=A0A378JHH7_9GAMM|nr:type IVB secretion system protein IcmG/DotF [Legionella busanensis]STX50635.1 protein IcmG (DotF) [Legionella busanensis]